MNDNDLRIVIEVLKMKLSVEVIFVMKFLIDINVNEFYYRFVSVNMFKNVKFLRIMEGCLYFMIYRRNNLLGILIRFKCEFVGV